MKLASLSIILACTLASTPVLADVASQRQEIRTTCQQALDTLYHSKPELKASLAKAAGYGCFSSVGVALFVGGAGGSGLVHNNATKADTFMNMGQASAGTEIGFKDYREVLVFHSAATLKKFIDTGWEFSAKAGASAKAEGQGKQLSHTLSVDGIDIYPLTKTGIDFGASVGSRKYWKNDELN